MRGIVRCVRFVSRAFGAKRHEQRPPQSALVTGDLGEKSLGVAPTGRLEPLLVGDNQMLDELL